MKGPAGPTRATKDRGRPADPQARMTAEEGPREALGPPGRDQAPHMRRTSPRGGRGGGRWRAARRSPGATPEPAGTSRSMAGPRRSTTHAQARGPPRREGEGQARPSCACAEAAPVGGRGPGLRSRRVLSPAALRTHLGRSSPGTRQRRLKCLGRRRAAAYGGGGGAARRDPQSSALPRAAAFSLFRRPDVSRGFLLTPLPLSSRRSQSAPALAAKARPPPPTQRRLARPGKPEEGEGTVAPRGHFRPVSAS